MSAADRNFLLWNDGIVGQLSAGRAAVVGGGVRELRELLGMAQRVGNARSFYVGRFVRERTVERFRSWRLWRLKSKAVAVVPGPCAMDSSGVVRFGAKCGEERIDQKEGSDLI